MVAVWSFLLSRENYTSVSFHGFGDWCQYLQVPTGCGSSTPALSAVWKMPSRWTCPVISWIRTGANLLERSSCGHTGHWALPSLCHRHGCLLGCRRWTQPVSNLRPLEHGSAIGGASWALDSPYEKFWGIIGSGTCHHLPRSSHSGGYEALGKVWGSWLMLSLSGSAGLWVFGTSSSWGTGSFTC